LTRQQRKWDTSGRSQGGVFKVKGADNHWGSRRVQLQKIDIKGKGTFTPPLLRDQYHLGNATVEKRSQKLNRETVTAERFHELA